MAAASGAVVVGVRISHPDRVVYPRQGVTKLALARYYERVAERMLPHTAGRLLALVRCPQGRTSQCFFQKHPSEGFPAQLSRQPMRENGGNSETYLYVTDAAGLIAAVQMGTLEFHIWWSRVDRLERPDRLVFDLDPDEGLPFTRVREAAAEVRDRLKEIGFDSLALVTGGKGVHVVVPLERRADAEVCRIFAESFARRMAADAPDQYTATMSKVQRRGRIFVDWLRNQRGNTAIAPYSTRAREDVPVAMPVAWAELAGLASANGFRIDDVEARLDRADPWAVARTWRQSVSRTACRALGA